MSRFLTVKFKQCEAIMSLVLYLLYCWTDLPAATVLQPALQSWHQSIALQTNSCMSQNRTKKLQQNKNVPVFVAQ